MGNSWWKIAERYEAELFVNPRKVRDELIPLFKRVLDEERTLEAFLIWPLLIKAIIFSWDDFFLLDQYLPWVRENPLPETLALIPDLRAAVMGAYFGGLLFRQPENPELSLLEKRLFGLLKLCRKEGVRLDGLFFLAIYAFWQGNLKRLHHLIDELGRSNVSHSAPARLLTSWIRAGRNIWVYADLQAAEEELAQAHRLAWEKGLHLWDHVLYALQIACALLSQRFQEARKLLGLMEEGLSKTGRHGRYHFFYLWGWLYFLEGDLGAAELAMRRALEIAQETGYLYPYYLSHFALAQILFRKGHVPEALSALRLCETFARQTKSRLLSFMCLLFRAQLAYLAGDQAFGRFYLSRALSLGNRENYFQFLWWSNPQMMTKLCTQALEEGLETEYVRRFILKQKLSPPSGRRPPPGWPYPLRIHTLGRLEILIDDKPLKWSRRSPERPLALLLALVAAGGTIDRERLLDLLWPDLEADKAYHALESTLYRLRNLLGLRQIIVSKGHRLHLERDQVFVDLWHLKERLEELERVSTRGDLLKAFFLVQEILETYAEFLPGLEYPFVIFEREALKSRLFSLLKRLSRPLARAFPEQARFLLERIWLLDPTDEEFFRPLFEFLAEESPEVALDLFRRFATLLEAQGKEVSSGLKERIRSLKEKVSAS